MSPSVQSHSSETVLQSLKIASLNCHGFNQGAGAISALCDKNDLDIDIIFLQELWLTPDAFTKIESFDDNYICFGKSAMDAAVRSSVLKGRPFGGLCILLKSQIAQIVRYSKISERYAAIIIDNYLIVNVYFPTISNDADLCIVQSMIADIEEIIVSYPGLQIVCGGDFNVNLDKLTGHSRIFASLMSDCDLISTHSIIPSNMTYTYCHETLQRFSYIDYFLISHDIKPDLRDFKIIDLAVNQSDHCIIFMELGCNLVLKIKDTQKINDILNLKQQFKLRWDHAKLSKYYDQTRILLQPIYEWFCSEYDNYCLNYDLYLCGNYSVDKGHVYAPVGSMNDAYSKTRFGAPVNYMYAGFVHASRQPVGLPDHIARGQHIIELVYDKLVDSLKNAAHSSIPLEQCNFRKFWWDQTLDELKQQSIATHNAWVEASRPRQGPIFESRCKARAAYRNCIRQNQTMEKENVSNNLHDALIKKSPDRFWKVWNSKFGSKKRLPDSVDGLHDDQTIANNFANHFAKSCSPLTTRKHENMSQKFISHWANYEGDLILLHDNDNFGVEMLDKIITDLNLGKAAGIDSLTSEHLKYCHPIVYSILSRMFKLMLRCEYVPDAFGRGLTVPLPKQDSLAKRVGASDFRGITVSPVISKVFEHCLVRYLNSYLKSSDMQFGFKKGFGCNHAIYTVRTTIDYFTAKNSTVNLCALDLASAFDRVNHYALFSKLMDRNVPRKYIAILKCWYVKVSTVVRWNDCISHSVRLTAGVRQGGVLSPLLFALFVDDLLVKLSKCSLGCYISGICVNAVMYADDILLMSISVCDMQKMVDLCIKEFNEVDMAINVKKSICMRIGPRHNVDVSKIAINAETLEWKNELKYLGVNFLSANVIRCNLQIMRQKYFRALNGIFYKIGTRSSPMVILSLVDSFCIPILSYGVESFNIRQADYNYLDAAYNAAFAKVFSTFDRDIIRCCQFYCGAIPFNMKIDIKRLKFYCSLSIVKNDSVRGLFILNGQDELSRLLTKHNLVSASHFGIWKYCIYKNFSDSVAQDIV